MKYWNPPEGRGFSLPTGYVIIDINWKKSLFTSNTKGGKKVPRLELPMTVAVRKQETKEAYTNMKAFNMSL